MKQPMRKLKSKARPKQVKKKSCEVHDIIKLMEVNYSKADLALDAIKSLCTHKKK